MKFGFAFRRLALIGPGKVPAEVTFMRGLNVIGGPSDSGKSFIAQCIDYALGGGAAPKEIPEAEGYSSVVIDIEANSDGRVYSLERSLRGGEVLCKTDGRPDRVLAAKHQGGRSTPSRSSSSTCRDWAQRRSAPMNRARRGRSAFATSPG